MTLLAISFFAGTLTVLAPCIFPLLPVVLGAGAAGRSRATPYIVIGSLAASVVVFTFLLKASTALITVPPMVWPLISGGVIMLVGLTLAFPSLWERLPLARAASASQRVLSEGYQKKSIWGDVLMGAALGPVFSTCSPTYFFILASVLPASFGLGTIYILAFVAGLSIVLLSIALLGERVVSRFASFTDARGTVKRGTGVVLFVLGVLIISGYDKKIETAILNAGWGATGLEYQLLERAEKDSDVERDPGAAYIEIENPSGFVNATPFALADLVGKKVILLDFMTYSCINCQRTFPYLNAWHEAYKDEGLQVVGIHTPEFAFEKDIENVRKAAAEFGLTFPIVLDNEYATWNAYGNRYWPRKYLIDINGTIVYDHIGEGAYEETEMKIRELLEERSRALSGSVSLGEVRAAAIPPSRVESRSPETYFGSLRNEYAPQVRFLEGEHALSFPPNTQQNTLLFDGRWNIAPEYAEALDAGSVIRYRYSAKEVYIVAESDTPVLVEVLQDGELLEGGVCVDGVCEMGVRGEDVSLGGTVEIGESRLYKLIRNPSLEEHTLELRVLSPGVRFFAFTFG
jgi:cytochrome c biogenesis protein CcdA/thiol-disulfide isomerase/thioredoxin